MTPLARRGRSGSRSSGRSSPSWSRGAAARTEQGSAVASPSSSGRVRDGGRAGRLAGGPRNPIGWICCSRGARYRSAGCRSPADATAASAPALGAWLGAWVWMAGIGPAADVRCCCCSPTGACRRRAGGRSAGSPPPRSSRPGAAIALEPGAVRGLDGRNPLGLDAAPGAARRARERRPGRAGPGDLRLDRRRCRPLPARRAASSASSSSGSPTRGALVGVALAAVIADRDGRRRPGGRPDQRDHLALARAGAGRDGASRSCATGSTTSTSSSTARWSTAR